LVGKRDLTGTIFWFEHLGHVHKNARGEANGLVWIMRDITIREQMENALRESELKFKTLATNIPVAIFFHRGGKFVYCNPAAVAVSGYDIEELTGLEFWQLAAPELQSIIKERGLARLGGMDPPQRYILQIVRKDGQRRWIDLTNSIFEHDGQIAVIGAGIDVTDRIETENKLKTSLEENKLLLREIHHRVKNNLQVISGLLHLQASRISDPAARENFLQCQLRIKAMAMVHSTLYNRERLDSIDFRVYVDNLVDNLYTVYGCSRERIRLTTRVDVLDIDLDKAINFGLILNELVSNALKHAFPADRTGELFLGFTRLDDDRITLTVRDNGIGLAPEVDLSTLTTLGMVLVRSLTEQMDGVLTLKRDTGTEISIVFPHNEKGVKK
jgi:PAS domain S-box-containing protein